MEKKTGKNQNVQKPSAVMPTLHDLPTPSADNVAPIEPKLTEQRIEYLALDDLQLADYQRDTDSKQVASIVGNFNRAKIGILTVSLRNGIYHTIDGGHRSVALRTLGYTHAYCDVLTGLTYEQESELFRKQNDNKRAVKPYDFFQAGLRGGDMACVRINESVEMNGFRIVKSRISYKDIMAINALIEIYETYGTRVLDDTLRLISTTWSGVNKATHAECMLGVAEFVHRYGMVDFAERLCEKFTLIWNNYTESFHGRGTTGAKMARKKLCRVLVEHYNKGLNGSSKKRLKWTDEDIPVVKP